MPPFAAAIFRFIVNIPVAVLNFLDRGRQWAKEDRAEIEQTYRDELQVLQDLLNDTETADEKEEIRAEIRRVQYEFRLFHRARLELLLSKAVVERMAPRGSIAADLPELPPAEREALKAAAVTINVLEPPKTVDEHIRQGNAFHAADQFDKALEQYSRALELKPDDPDTLNNRGIILRHLQRYDEALADFKRSLLLRPGDPGALYNRACVYSLMGQLHDSLKQLKEAISADAEYRSLARHDEDFANLRSDPTLGPEFERLVAEPGV